MLVYYAMTQEVLLSPSPRGSLVGVEGWGNLRLQGLGVCPLGIIWWEIWWEHMVGNSGEIWWEILWWEVWWDILWEIVQCSLWVPFHNGRNGLVWKRGVSDGPCNNEHMGKWGINNGFRGTLFSDEPKYYGNIINGKFRILKWRYVSTMFLAIFCGDIPWNLGLKNRPYIW